MIGTIGMAGTCAADFLDSPVFEMEGLGAQADRDGESIHRKGRSHASPGAACVAVPVPWGRRLQNDATAAPAAARWRQRRCARRAYSVAVGIVSTEAGWLSLHLLALWPKGFCPRTNLEKLFHKILDRA
jgi:hypothetical protein